MEEIEYKFKRTGAQIENLLDKIPVEGDVAKVYNTTLYLFGIENGSVVTQEQIDEVSNIIDKWKQGYIVTYIGNRHYNYGTLSVRTSDDYTEITLSIIDLAGDLIAYTFDGTAPGYSWTVTNKTSGGGGGNTLFLTTPYLLYEGGDLNASDSAILNSLKGQETKNLAITYCCSTLSGDESVPLQILYDYSQIPFQVTLFYGESSLVISEDENVVGKYIADPPIKVYPYKFPVKLNGSFNINDKNYQFNFNDIKPVIDGWCVFDGSINFYLEGTAYTCSFSIPMNVYKNRPDRNMYNAIAINGLGTISYPVAITFSSGLVFVKVLTSLNVSKIEMNSPACRLIRL